MRWRRLSEEEIEGCITAPEAGAELPSEIVNCWKVIRGQWAQDCLSPGERHDHCGDCDLPSTGP